MNKSYIIYAILCRDNDKSYVGQTSRSLHKRWVKHCYNAKIGLNTYFARAIAKHGVDRFIAVEIDRAASREEADAKERWYIQFSKSNIKGVGYNLGDGGEGVTATPEVRKKLHDRFLGKNSVSYRHDILNTEVAARYLGGETMESIADSYGVSVATIWKRLRIEKTTIRSRGTPRGATIERSAEGKRNIALAASKGLSDSILRGLYESGVPVRDIARTYSVCTETVYRHLRGDHIWLSPFSS